MTARVGSDLNPMVQEAPCTTISAHATPCTIYRVKTDNLLPGKLPLGYPKVFFILHDMSVYLEFDGPERSAGENLKNIEIALIAVKAGFL